MEISIRHDRILHTVLTASGGQTALSSASVFDWSVAAPTTLFNAYARHAGDILRPARVTLSCPCGSREHIANRPRRRGIV